MLPTNVKVLAKALDKAYWAARGVMKQSPAAIVVAINGVQTVSVPCKDEDAVNQAIITHKNADFLFYFSANGVKRFAYEYSEESNAKVFLEYSVEGKNPFAEGSRVSSKPVLVQKWPQKTNVASKTASEKPAPMPQPAQEKPARRSNRRTLAF